MLCFRHFIVSLSCFVGFLRVSLLLFVVFVPSFVCLRSVPTCPIAEDPCELSNHVTAPGVLKIFGSEIYQGAHYKSVLATTQSSAKELVKEALERYGLSKEEADLYVLCDAIGSISNRQWKTEGVRVVGDSEKPLLLQSLWKPREGLARRFEIQRRSSVEEMASRERDTVTAGINAQARKLQKSRSRVASTLSERSSGRSELWRSRSSTDMLDCAADRSPTHQSQNSLQIFELPETGLEQRHIDDFIIYLLVNQNITVGRARGNQEPKADVALSANDILPMHCQLLRHQDGCLTSLRPCPNAAVTRNAVPLTTEATLSSGDIIGFGERYLFMFKDPADHPTLPAVPWLPAHSPTSPNEPVLCNTCLSTCPDHTPAVAAPCFKSPDGQDLTITFPAHALEMVLKEIVALGAKERPPLTVAFLLSTCVQYCASRLQASELRRLLLLTASRLQSTVWVSQDESSCLISIQCFIKCSLNWICFIPFSVLQIYLSCVRSAMEETIAVLEEVIMLAFQQCVYYITKVLYPLLPPVLDCNPFRESPDTPTPTGSAPGLDGPTLRVPDEVQRVVGVLSNTWGLLRDSQLHPELSAQLIAYLFYFINASLFNSLMERGLGSQLEGFYQWSRGVHLRASLDLILDWAHDTGLGELAQDHTVKLSSAINLLATPRKTLLKQTCWSSLRSLHAALHPAQLHHLLSLYSPTSHQPRRVWSPSVPDRVAAQHTCNFRKMLHIFVTFIAHRVLNCVFESGIRD
uniref:Si:ch211-176g6.2 n=1 Tax=Neogobius melanostomus TaxID=47308 RepID=A0A8C6TTQ1_9GOBI